ncbi:MAG TPA: pentapeptide repeat-containing protein [Puia sp.]|nr:pentapeptide repeat-containing protein [Puia sp.]
MNARSKKGGHNNHWALTRFNGFIALASIFIPIGFLLFSNEFENMGTSFTSPPLAHTIEDSLLPKSAYWTTFKNANYINDTYSRNNSGRPKDLILYKTAFLLDTNDAACGCDEVPMEKDYYGGDPCREIYCNDFNDVLFAKCLFSHQVVAECDFKSAVFDSTSFVHCKFMFCDFSRAVINSSVTFKDCRFIYCIFRNANFSPRLEDSLELNECDLFHCNLFAGNFDSTALEWRSNNNVYYMNCQSARMKDKLKQLGLKEDVEYVTAAEKKNLILNYANRQNYFTQHLLLGNFLNDYGTNPLKPLIPIFFLLPVFFLIYYRMSFQRCIFLTWNGSLKNKGVVNKYTTDVNRFVNGSIAKRFEAVMAFTFISCFSFGFSLLKGLDFQTIISAFQKRNVLFSSEGTVKLITGFQSLLVFLCFTLSIIALL